MMRFSLTQTPIAGVVSVQRQRLADERGFLSRFFCAVDLAAAGFDRPVAQINHTLTRRTGTVRGMHFQRAPHAEIKMVSCVRGEVFDVALDLRRGSPTYLRWHAQVLSVDNLTSLLVPPGCAHGFQTLSPDCEMLYLHSAAYQPAYEGGANALDPAFSIAWPLTVAETSARDAAHPLITASFDAT